MSPENFHRLRYSNNVYGHVRSIVRGDYEAGAARRPHQTRRAALGMLAAAASVSAAAAGAPAAAARTRNPCSLVTGTQAARIVGSPVQRHQAPLGPTCIYSYGRGQSVTLTIEPIAISTAVQTIRHGKPIKIRGRLSYCAVAGHQALFSSLPHARVLEVSARCSLARRFADRALRSLRL